MSESISIGLAQINPTVGDLNGNIKKILTVHSTLSQKVDIIVFPEMSLIGYPPEDLVYKNSFQKKIEQAIYHIAKFTQNKPAILLGAPWVSHGKLYNAALLLENGQLSQVRYKNKLPDYGVFDESRIFCSGKLPDPIPFKNTLLGVMICEDMWTPQVTEYLAQQGAEILIVLNASPFETEKWQKRHQHAETRVRESHLPLIYVNQVGGQDELVFDGASFVLDANNKMVQIFSEFCECHGIVNWDVKHRSLIAIQPNNKTKKKSELQSIYLAAMLGLKDYVEKNKFNGVVLGLSGGIDSALTAAISVDALGAEKVHVVMLPSIYTSSESLEDAKDCATRLGLILENVSIIPAVKAYEEMLSPLFQNCKADLTEENIQSRIRGMVLMALSNKFGWMVLSTGNKSELSVGYSTLYGDSCGGYSVLKDIYKTTVYALSEWRNNHCPNENDHPNIDVIPERILIKAPTAELRPNQTDQDSLPPYDVLDGILQCFIEQDFGLEETVEAGYDKETVQRVYNLLHKAEYKRRQSPPGVKITSRCFGRDRRYPITNLFLGLPLEFV